MSKPAPEQVDTRAGPQRGERARTRDGARPADRAQTRAGERRERLLDAARELIRSGESDLSVRAVLRTAGLNPRYFYESFVDLDELLGDLYDAEMAGLAARVDVDLTAMPAEAGPAAVIRAGIESVLRHLTEQPFRGRVLISGWPGNPTLGRRRQAGFLRQIEAYRTDPRLLGPAGPPASGAPPEAGSDADHLAVFGTMFAGSMGALAAAWADGRLGDDLDEVVDRAVELALALFRTATAGATLGVADAGRV